jgi:hypothetical protein
MDEPVPTGRYAIVTDRQTVYVKLTRNTRRNWTSMYVSAPQGEWVEVHKPELRANLIARLRAVDLPTASCLFTSLTGLCGVCGRPNDRAAEHNKCLTRRFGVLEEVKGE